MRFFLGFLTGIGTAWAALAIWHHTGLPEGEWHTDVPDEDAWPPEVTIDPDAFETVTEAGRRGYTL